MAIKSYPVQPGESAEQFIRKIPVEEIKKNGALEMFHCFDAIRIWDDCFRPKFGELLSLTHRTNPDDPPDVEAVFEHGKLPMEHTCIEPENRRQVDALMPKQARLIIPASNKVKGAKGIIKASNIRVQSPGADAVEEAFANYDILAAAMRKKMAGNPGGR